MKSKSIFITLALTLVIAANSLFAQTTTSSFKVNGNCGMCKKKIETAAKNSGATYAVWDKTTHVLLAKYSDQTTSQQKIEEAIAAAGYDTENVKATEEAYNNLEGCCQYKREETVPGLDTGVPVVSDKKACCNKKAGKEECKKGDKKKDCCKKEGDACKEKTKKAVKAKSSKE